MIRRNLVLAAFAALAVPRQGAAAIHGHGHRAH